MLSLAEELLLLALDEETGELTGAAPATLSAAIAGALVMDLALANRIDSDLKDVWVVNQAPTDNSLLDETLARLGRPGERRPTQQLLRTLASRAPELKVKALDRLVQRGILRRDESRVLWAFHAHRYTTLDGRNRQEVRARLRTIVLGREIPDPRDVVLVSLAHACRLLAELLTIEELAGAREHILTLARLDLVGQQVAGIVRGIEQELLLAGDHLG